MRLLVSGASQSVTRRRLLGVVLASAILTCGCFTSQGVGPNASLPLETVRYVDLERFVGAWYVIESIGLGAEEGAHDEVETYTLREDGRIDIALTFRDGAFDGPEKSIPQLGWVHDWPETNAEWRVRPFWPLSLAYLIIDLDENYAWTVVGHPLEALGLDHGARTFARRRRARRHSRTPGLSRLRHPPSGDDSPAPPRRTRTGEVKLAHPA